MSDPVQALAGMRRPKILIRAARAGIADYQRARDLKRLMRTAAPPAPGAALARLMDEESRTEETRRTGDASYSVTRHIDLLIALMVEARLLPRPDHA